MRVTLSNKTSFVPFYKAIRFVLDFIDPLAANGGFSEGHYVRTQVEFFSRADNSLSIASTQ